MLYLIRINGEAQGPWPLQEIVMMSGVSPETPVCPEFDLGAWRPLEAVIDARGDLAFLFQIRTRAEQLLRTNQKLRWELRQRVDDHAKALEAEKQRTAGAVFELERRKAQLDEVLDHNLELDTATDETRERLETAERRFQETRKEVERLETERGVLKRGIETLERELEEMRRLSSDTEAARERLETLRAELESVQRERIRERAVKEARDRQFEELRSELEEARRKTVALEARLRTQTFEAETLAAERTKELQFYKLKAERAETSLEEKRGATEELRLRLEAAAARAAEAESRLRAAASSSTVEEESLKHERETLAAELEKAKLLAGERSKTLEDLRNQLEILRDRATEAENRLRVAQTKFAGTDANLREEKETLARRFEAERGRREQAERSLATAQEEIASFRTQEDAASKQSEEKRGELEGRIGTLKQELLRKAQTIERLETRLQEAVHETPIPLPAESPSPEKPETARARPIPPRPETPKPVPPPKSHSPQEPEPVPARTAASPPSAPAVKATEAAAAPVEAPPTAAVPSPPERAAAPTGPRPAWKLAVAAALAVLIAGGVWFFKTRRRPPAHPVERPPERTLLPPPAPAPVAQPERPPAVLRPPRKISKPRKRLKRVLGNRSAPPSGDSSD